MPVSIYECICVPDVTGLCVCLQRGDRSVTTHHLEYSEGGILDMDDLLTDLVEDRDKVGTDANAEDAGMCHGLLDIYSFQLINGKLDLLTSVVLKHIGKQKEELIFKK